MATEGSEYDRLFYPNLFEGGTASMDAVLAHVRHSTLEKCRETIALRQATLAGYRAQILGAGLAMATAFQQGATLFAFGNGGSTTDAQDVIADLMMPPPPTAARPIQRPALPAIALTNDNAVITAIANDVGADNIFARQIIAFGKAGDIAFGLSTSGNSLNVQAAFEQAKKRGMLTVGLAGYDGGNMARSPAVDYCIVAPGANIPRIQEAHATVYHTLLELVYLHLEHGG